MAKRSFDILFAVVGLTVTLPLLTIAAIFVKIGDGGSIFFQQTRVGRFGREFRMFKFRTMHEGAEERGLGITAGGDSRITAMGRLLRKTKIDELPQLWNVLLGQMSFVGPRPEIPRYVMLYSTEQLAVLNLLPGITDEASIAFRNEESVLSDADDIERRYIEYCIPTKIAINLEYAKHATVFKDMQVILRTIACLFR